MRASSTTRARRGLCALAVTALVGVFVVTTSGPASATQFDVTNTNDSGAGSLRQAIADAASNSGDDTIVVQQGLGTIALTSGPLFWDGNTGAVTIEGNDVTVDFGGAERGFVDNGGFGLEIDSMTITGVTGSGSDDNAPVVSEGGTVVVAKCTITGNNVTTDEGDVAGGVLSEGGDVTVNACTITGNTAHGAEDGAGGVLSEGGNVNVSNSTISGNTVVAGGDAGGGVASEGGNIVVAGSTIDCNQATGGGDAAGGILNEGGESFTIRDSNIVGNAASSTDSDSQNAILSNGVTPTINGSTVSDDTSACTTPVTTPTTSESTTSTTAAAAATTQPRFTG